jgi:hypothetical protein
MVARIFRYRARLAELATSELPWLAFNPAETRWNDPQSMLIEGIVAQYPQLHFEVFNVNGADDVAKYYKWQNTGAHFRMLAMGRVGFTEASA